MKIVLVEERGGEQTPELTFQTEAVRIGRDAGECQIAFERSRYPMVSRRHAEIRLQNGQWFLIDNNSTYGTFINGKKVGQPELIQVGSTIQCGANGPILIVLLLDAAPEKSPVGAAQSDRPANNYVPSNVSSPAPPPKITPQNTPISQNQTPASPVVPPPILPPPVEQTPTARLEYVGANAAMPFDIKKDRIWFGRDPQCDIVPDADAVMVSRKHAEIVRENGAYILTDNKSFNGTLVNGQRISSPTPVYHGDEIQLGLGGPVLKFNSPQRVAPKGASLAGQRSVPKNQQTSAHDTPAHPSTKTIAFKGGSVSQQIAKDDGAQPQLLMQLTFGGKPQLGIGRSEDNDINLDGLQISNKHARLVQTHSGIVIEDLNSTNGVYLNGQRIYRQTITPNDAAQIGSFQIRVDGYGNVAVFDTRSKTRIDSVNITKEVKNRAGGGTIRLLDNVSLSIQPNEFVGLLGPSGAGKSTFMDALNGMRPASGGSVLINNLDLYQNLDALKQSIGYVPQDDIIHRELTVYRTLYYVAKLRLSGDVSRQEIDQIISEVMDVTGLSERRDVPINQLSGGQRKRVSIAVELITKPSVIFLDEPTSGLDPATEEKIMRLFRQIAESGRTVILTTHAMENVKLFDKIVLLMRGKLVFYGKPDEALAHVGAASFKELYDKIEEPIEKRIQASPGAGKHQITEQVAEDWKQKFTHTPQFKNNVYEPLKQISGTQSAGVQKKRRLGIFGALRQWLTLSRRYLEVLLRDKTNLFILLAQAPIVAFLTFLVMDDDQPRDFVYFVLSLVAVWFGTSVAAREIIRERAVYNRERMVNLGLLPYLGSKLFILGIIVGIQCLLLFVPLKLFHAVGLMDMPGVLGGIPQLFVMLLTAGVGVALGLLVSALVKTSEMATSLVPLILIPQILFSGLVGIPTGLNKVVGLAMPATWSFDTMKRFSDLETLREAGDKDKRKDCAEEPCGLYRRVEDENKGIIGDAKREIEQNRDLAQKDLDKYEGDLENYMRDAQTNPGIEKPEPPELRPTPQIKDAAEIPANLSNKIDFLHPWMNEVLNQMVLVIMFFMLFIMTLIVLRTQDIG